jgi:succinate dehydrogenase / fumarate reductase cytochrome b subunit
MSIFHRVTGVGLAGGAALVVWWLLAAATGPEYFALADGFLTSWFGTLILAAATFALFYHFCNGIRHLWWDAGWGFGLDQVTQSGYVTIAAAGALTLLTFVLA